MDTPNTSIETALHALLAGNEGLQRSISALQDGQAKLQADVAGIRGTMAQYATKAEVETVRTEVYKAMSAQTWTIVAFMTTICSALTAAVYFIARNVH